MRRNTGTGCEHTSFQLAESTRCRFLLRFFTNAPVVFRLDKDWRGNWPNNSETIKFDYGTRTTNRRNFLRATTASTIGLVAGVQATAAEPQYTWIYVKDMHCLHCAKTIARKLYTVPGVVKVQAYLKQHIAVITPQSGKSVSPRTV